MKNVVVVEDEAHLRLLYEIELTHAGYRTMTAANARECLELIKVMDIDLVVLDIRMPGMDGIELLGNILARKRSLPVVIHSAFSSFRDNYLTWGAAAYLVKSSDLRELIATVERLLQPETRKSPSARKPGRMALPSNERTDHVAQTL